MGLTLPLTFICDSFPKQIIGWGCDGLLIKNFLLSYMSITVGYTTAASFKQPVKSIPINKKILINEQTRIFLLFSMLILAKFWICSQFYHLILFLYNIQFLFCFILSCQLISIRVPSVVPNGVKLEKNLTLLEYTLKKNVISNLS